MKRVLFGAGMLALAGCDPATSNGSAGSYASWVECGADIAFIEILASLGAQSGVVDPRPRGAFEASQEMSRRAATAAALSRPGATPDRAWADIGVRTREKLGVLEAMYDRNEDAAEVFAFLAAANDNAATCAGALS